MPALRNSALDLIANLRALAARQTETAAERDGLIADSVTLKVDISLDHELANIVPESVWHFLSDADIRFRDSRYASAQLSALASSLAAWEGEVASIADRNI